MLAPATGVSFPVFAMETGSLVLLPPRISTFSKVGLTAGATPGQEEGEMRGGKRGRK